EHIARGEHCRGALGWSFALSLLQRSGFPERWPDRPVAAVRAFVAALVTDYLEHPDAWSAAFADDLRGPGLPVFLSMADEGCVGVEAVFAGAEAAPEAARAREIARWTVGNYAAPYAAQGQPGFEAVAEYLAADTFVSPKAMDVTKCWLVLQEPWVMIPRALERETEPEWQDVLDEAATLWAAAARDGREGRAVSPWRSRSRYLRRYRQKRRRRSGRGPTTG
ncbi:MAG: hypothetical protein AAFP67_08830, partial [Pseudomonadota bacterium]